MHYLPAEDLSSLSYCASTKFGFTYIPGTQFLAVDLMIKCTEGEENSSTKAVSLSILVSLVPFFSSLLFFSFPFRTCE